MAQNPFYVDPGNDLSPGLNGLSSVLVGMREQQQRQALTQQKLDAEAQKQQRFEQASAAAAEAFKGGDPEKIALASIQYPEIAEALKMSTGLKSDLQNQSALGFTRSLALADPASRPAIYEARIKEIEDRGGDATHTKQSYQDYQANPEAEARSVISYWAGIDPKGYQAFADERKAEAKANLESQKMAAEESRFNRSEAGKNSRAALTAGDRALTRELDVLKAKQGAEMNDLKRAELGLKIQDKQAKLDQGKIERKKEVDTATANIDASIASAEKLLSHPGFSSAVGLSSVLPTRPGSDSADFEAELDSFNAKTFLSNVSQMKGLGALTEAEGAKITAAAGAVKKDMSEKALRKNLETMKDGMEKAKQRIQKMYGTQAAPATSPAPSQPASGGIKFLGFE
jgi:hypothetical protein